MLLVFGFFYFNFIVNLFSGGIIYCIVLMKYKVIILGLNIQFIKRLYCNCKSNYLKNVIGILGNLFSL